MHLLLPASSSSSSEATAATLPAKPLSSYDERWWYGGQHDDNASRLFIWEWWRRRRRGREKRAEDEMKVPLFVNCVTTVCAVLAFITHTMSTSIKYYLCVLCALQRSENCHFHCLFCFSTHRVRLRLRRSSSRSILICNALPTYYHLFHFSFVIES